MILNIALIIQLKKYRFPSIINALIIIALNFHWIAQAWVVVDFYVHRDKIIAESCVQRNSVKNCCQGSCQLNVSLSKINTINTESNSTPELKIQNFDFFNEIEMISIFIPPTFSTPNSPGDSYAVSSGYLNKVTHPPSIA